LAEEKRYTKIYKSSPRKKASFRSGSKTPFYYSPLLLGTYYCVSQIEIQTRAVAYSSPVLSSFGGCGFFAFLFIVSLSIQEERESILLYAWLYREFVYFSHEAKYETML